MDLAGISKLVKSWHSMLRCITVVINFLMEAFRELPCYWWLRTRWMVTSVSGCVDKESIDSQTHAHEA